MIGNTPSPREVAYSEAVAACLKARSDDSELLTTLGTLSLKSNAATPRGLLSIFASKAFSRHLCSLNEYGNDNAPRLGEFLFFLVKNNFELGRKSFAKRLSECANGTQESRADSPAETLLARSPWAQTIGLHLNECSPESAKDWPAYCVLSGIDIKQARVLAKQAGKGASPQASQALLRAAFQARDEDLLRFAIGETGNPERESFRDLLSMLDSDQAHYGFRKSLRLEKKNTLAAPEALSMLLSAYDSQELAQTALDALCLNQLCLPAQFDASQWGQCFKAMASRGASEPSLECLLSIIKDSSKRQEDISRMPIYFSPKERCVEIGARSLQTHDLDELAKQCLRKALLPRRFSYSDTEPPLAYRLMEMLPDAGSKTQKAIIETMDKWSETDFGKNEMAWRRGSSGHTQSIGSAIAGLPRLKAPGRNFEQQSAKWLAALARQGFDFEAKASPKSKSLGERMRSNANLKAFWPLVEAAALSNAAHEAPSSKRKSL